MSRRRRDREADPSPAPAPSAAGAAAPPPAGLLGGLRDWHAILFLTLAVAFFFRRILLGRAFLWEDILFQVYPFRHFAASSLARGDLPLWNPYAFGGMPFQADIQSAVFYIPHLLLTPFASGGPLSFQALQVMLVAHYVLAAAGMYVLARAGGLERIYATFAGLAYALSGFMIVHAIHPGFIEQAAWLPWILWCLHRAIDRQSLRHAIVTGLLAGHAVLAGAPQISLYLFMLMAIWSLFAFGARVHHHGVQASLPALWLPAIAVAIAFGVAAIQLLPTMELGPLSERDALSFEAAQAGRLEWGQLITGVLPKFFGEMTASQRTWWGPGIYGSYWETCFYWGIPVLLAGAFALTLVRRHALALLLAGLVLFSFLLAVGDQFVLHRIFYAIVPGFSTFRVPARIVFIATVAMSLLGAMGLRALVAMAETTPRRVEAAAAGALLATLLLWVAVRQGVFPAGPSLDAIDMSRREATIALALVGAMAVLAVLLARRLLSPAVVVGAIVLLQLGDMTRFGQDQNTGSVDAEHYYHARPERRMLIQQLQAEGEHQLFRVATRDGAIKMLDRNQGMVDGLYLTEGYTPLRLRRVLPPAATLDRSLDLLNAKYRSRADTLTNKVKMFGVPSYYPRAMLIPRDTVIADDSAAAAFMRRPEFDPARLVVLAEPLASPLPPVVAPGPDTTAALRMLEYRPNAFRLEVRTDHPGVLLLSEIYYPGWRAEVDGQETKVHRADWSLRAIPLAAGSHVVTMRFDPRSFRTGRWITLGTLVLAVGGLVAAGRWPRRTAATT